MASGLGFAAIVLGLNVGRGGAALLARGPVAWIGVRCYGIYLWSWPIQRWIDTNLDGINPAARVATVAVLSIGFGAGSYRLIETPLRDGIGWATSLRRRQTWTVAAVAITVACLVGVATLPTTTPATAALSIEESARIALDNAAAQPLDTAPVATEPVATPLVTAQPVTPESVPGQPSGSTVTGSSPTPSEPLRVITAGDSQAFTAAHPPVPRRELPSYIGSVTTAGVLGCGILVRAEGWTMFDPDRGGFVDGSYCRETAEVAEQRLLASEPDWMVVFSGAFERPFRYRGPDGAMHEPRDPTIRAEVARLLTARIDRAAAHGVRTAILEWSCAPGEASDPDAVEGTIWYNTLIREVAQSRPGTITIPPTERVCMDADPTGEPTVEKNKAWGYEVHPADRGWLWTVQIGPALFAASVATP
ncbi:MAG: hypothetical protein GX868_10280 [Actinobacteria bacterium]|nr:hypothetical protein [Actinomycetota bacterium]